MANLDNLFVDGINAIEHSVKREIECYNDSIKSAKQKLKELKKKAQDRVNMARTLIAAELMNSDDALPYVTHERGYSEYNKLNVTGKLSKVRTLFGSEFIELDYDSKQEESSEDETIRVYLKANETYTGPRMYVVMPIPEGSLCKFETVIPSQSRPYKTLVCNRD